MKKLIWILLIGSTLSLHAERNATMLFDGGLNTLLVDQKSFYVSVTDEVTGGCLPKPDQLKSSMESSLKNNGFEVLKKNSSQTTEVHISTLGFRINGMCVVDFTVNIYFPILIHVPHADKVPSGNKTYTGYNYSVGRHIFNYRRNQMQKKLNKTVKSYGDKIYMSIAKAKDDIFTKFPSIEEEIKKKSN